MHYPPILTSLLPLCLTFCHLTLAHSANIVARRAPVDVLTETPVSLLQLTPDDFKQTIADGHWFLEYFSPSCPHCRDFAPTWGELVKDAKTEFPHLHLAQVNCALYGDLCGENHIESYPTLLLYASGEVLKEFPGARELSKLKGFIDRNVPHPAEAETELAVTTPSLNLDGKVLSLTSSSFTSTLAQGPMFVKFFAPWCTHCQKLAPNWTQLAKLTQNGRVAIAEVNCDEQGSLCKSNEIEGYPTLLFFDRDGKPTVYNSGRKLDQLLDFVEKAGAPPLQLIVSLEDLADKVHELKVVYLLLLRSDPSPYFLNGFKDAASSLLGQPLIFYSALPELIKEYITFQDPADSWAIMALRDHDPHSPSSVFLSSSLSIRDGDDPSRIRNPKSELSTWLRTHRLPTYVELTQDTFQQVMNAPEAPLVVIAASTGKVETGVEEKITSLATLWRRKTNWSGRAKASEGASGWGSAGLGQGERVESEVNEREVIFSWMDAGRWGEWMKRMYMLQGVDATTQVEDVRVVIADHQKLIYWDSDAQGEPLRLDDNLLVSIQNIVDGKLNYKQSENTIERLARLLSNGLVTAQIYIAEHMFRFLFYVVAVVAVVIWLVRRYIGSREHEYRRVERLD